MAVMGRKAVFIILAPVYRMRASLAAQMVKNLRATWETRVGPLGREDPLEKEMVTHSSILDWRIPWTVYIRVCVCVFLCCRPKINTKL